MRAEANKGVQLTCTAMLANRHCRVCCLLQVRVLYAFDAEAEGELTVAVGDSLWVETEVDGWYQVVRDGDGARGLVPTTYVDVEQF